MNTELIKKAEESFLKCKVCQVAYINEEGYPRICILKPLKSNGIKEFWFSTNSSSNKVKNFLKNNKAGINFYSDIANVTLTGKMEIVTEKNIKDELWQDFLGKHFSNGGKNDPEYCIIHFITNEVTIYINNKFETYKM